MVIITLIQLGIVKDLFCAVLNFFYVTLRQHYELGLIVYLHITREEMVAQER